VHEVKIGRVLDAVPERRPVDLAQPAPADHRQALAVSHQLDRPLEQTESLMVAVLGRLVEEQLIAEADAEQRLAAPGQVDDLPAQVALLQPRQGRREGPDTGQDETVGSAQVLLVRRDLRLGARVQQRALDRAQVANAVVDDGDHPSTPLDEGTPRPRTDIESRSASPNALKVDSDMWCRLLPRIRSTWMVAPRWSESARQNCSSTSLARVPIRPLSGTL